MVLITRNLRHPYIIVLYTILSGILFFQIFKLLSILLACRPLQIWLIFLFLLKCFCFLYFLLIFFWYKTMYMCVLVCGVNVCARVLLFYSYFGGNLSQLRTYSLVVSSSDESNCCCTEINPPINNSHISQIQFTRSTPSLTTSSCTATTSTTTTTTSTTTTPIICPSPVWHADCSR